MVITDPFDVLGIHETEPDAATLARAFAGAVARVGALPARQAMDALRRPEDRAVALLLAPSMTPAVVAARRTAVRSPATEEAVGFIAAVVADALDEIEASLDARIDHDPRIRRDPRAYSGRIAEDAL